jgi:hypothetical protein
LVGRGQERTRWDFHVVPIRSQGENRRGHRARFAFEAGEPVAGVGRTVREDWYSNSGDVEIHTGGSNPMTFKVSGPSAEHLRGLASGLGAVLTGRRTFDIA